MHVIRLLSASMVACVYHQDNFGIGRLSLTFGRFCTPQVVVRRATADVYAACIDSKVCVKVGYGNWSPGQDGVDIGQRDWGLAHSGSNFAVWEAIF